MWVVLLLVCIGTSASAHEQMWAEYLQHAPVGGKHVLVRHLEARGIRYVIAEYADAYPIAFLSGERIIAASSTRVRVRQYQEEFGLHRREAVRVARTPCMHGTEAMRGIYFCPAPPP